MNYQRKNDLVEYPIQDNVRLEVYWRDDRGGRGPAASLYVYDDEVFRFDCFGGDQGHCHVNLKQTGGGRWYYPEGTAQEHIERSAFELRVNLPFCFRANQDPRIQAVEIEQAKLEGVANQMQNKLLEFVNKLGI
jgi:hypothetical protein